MKNSITMLALAAICISCLNITHAADDENRPEWWADSMKGLDERMEWWEEARFALFMHWGAYSVLGGEYQGEELKGMYAEHIARICRIPKADYIKHAAGIFHPEQFDAEKWVLLAKKAGMKYLVITSKHHDGFAIYYSKHSDFDMEDTAKWHRDPLRELADACRKHGLRFGVYYSQAQDWYEPENVRNNWDFDHPTEKGWFNNSTPETRAHVKKMEAYLERKCIPQVQELIQDYKVDMIWFDTSSWMPPELNTRVLKAVREVGPDIVVSERIGGNMGDYRGGPDSPVVFPAITNRYWEAIQSTLHSWGYNKFDEDNRRPPDYLIRMLATVVSKGGNMMINVGPKPDGTLVEKDVETLEIIADWMEDQSASIHGAGKSPLPAQNWGVVTSKGNDLFLHVFDWPDTGKLRVGGLLTEVNSATLLKGNKDLEIKREDKSVISLGVPFRPSHPVNSVIKLSCASTPEADPFRLLEPDNVNRFHVYDNALIWGRGLSISSGKGEDAYISNWRDPEAEVIWKVRADEARKYLVHIIYDVSKKGTMGDGYQITIGTARFKGIVSKEGTGDRKYIEKEVALMRMPSSNTQTTIMVTDSLGILSLAPGEYDLAISSFGQKKNSELFKLRCVILEPVKEADIKHSVSWSAEPMKLKEKPAVQQKKEPKKMTVTGSFKPGEGSIVLEAKDAEIIGKAARYEKGFNKDNIGHWTDKNDRVKWSFTLSEPGEYEMGITFACPNGSAGSQIDIIVNDQTVSFAVEATDSWSRFKSKKIGQVNLSKTGEINLEVVVRDKPGFAVMNLHNLILRPVK